MMIYIFCSEHNLTMHVQYTSMPTNKQHKFEFTVEENRVQSLPYPRVLLQDIFQSCGAGQILSFKCSDAKDFFKSILS